ncbi:hypothetical protein V8G54_005797, partial [Vigna mungo]
QNDISTPHFDTLLTLATCQNVVGHFEIKKKAYGTKLKGKFGMKKSKLKFGGFFSFYITLSFISLSFSLWCSLLRRLLHSPLKPLHLLVLPLVTLIVLLVCLLSFFLFSFSLLIHFFHFPFLLFIFHFFFRLGRRTMGRRSCSDGCVDQQMAELPLKGREEYSHLYLRCHCFCLIFSFALLIRCSKFEALSRVSERVVLCSYVCVLF